MYAFDFFLSYSPPSFPFLIASFPLQLFVRNNPILHARKDAIEAVKANKGPENPDDPVEPIAPAPVPFVPPKPINHREMAHKISKTVVEQAGWCNG